MQSYIVCFYVIFCYRRYITGVDDPSSRSGIEKIPFLYYVLLFSCFNPRYPYDTLIYFSRVCLARVKNLGRLALAMTLDKAMQHFLDSSYSNFLVFEDDVIVNPDLENIKSQFVTMLRLPPSLWHIIQYLGFCFECGDGNRGLKQQQLYTFAVFPLCTHAILLRRATVYVVMNTYKPFVSNKGDWMLHVTACQYGLQVSATYCTPPFPTNAFCLTVLCWSYTF